MRATVGSLMFVLSVLLTVGATAAEKPDRYMVEMELWIDGQQRGTPMVVVEPGEPAMVEVSDPSGENGWKIDVLLDQPVTSEGAPAGSIWLNLAVHELSDGEWEPLTDSLLGLREGRTGTMAVVDSDVDEATRDNSLVYLTAQASLLQSRQTGD